MRNFFLSIFAMLLLCTACHTRKQVQTQHHAVVHATDSIAVQANTSSHAFIDSIGTTETGKDVQVDIIETVEHYDTLGRVTQKKTRKTSIHHKDSTQTVTDQHKIFADTAQIVKLQSSRKDIDVTVKEKKKTSWGSVVLEVVLGIITVIVLFFAIKAAKYILCRM